MRFQRGTRPAAGAARSEGSRVEKEGRAEGRGGGRRDSPSPAGRHHAGMASSHSPRPIVRPLRFCPRTAGRLRREFRIRGAPQRSAHGDMVGGRHVFDGALPSHGCEIHGPALRGQAINIDRRRRISEGPRPAPSATQGRSEARCRKKAVRNARKKAVSRPLD
jgi:hypothetical protein